MIQLLLYITQTFKILDIGFLTVPSLYVESYNNITIIERLYNDRAMTNDPTGTTYRFQLQFQAGINSPIPNSHFI